MTPLTQQQASAVLGLALLGLENARLRRVPGDARANAGTWVLEYGENLEHSFFGSTLRDLADAITGYEA